MTRRILVLLLTFVLGAIVGHLAIPSDVVNAQSSKTLMMTRLFTGPDDQTHSEEVPLTMTGGVSKFLPITSGELHVTSGGNVNDWHRAPRRQYVITLSGQGELEVAGGKKIRVGPGNIDLVEDTAGKGHITRVMGSEQRVTLQLPLADQAGH